MREIKFRGKRISNGQWVDGSLTLNPENKYPTIGDIYCEYDNGVKDNIFKEYSVDPKTVGQYTSRKDKNGKDIYEGDNVKFNIHNWKDEIYIATVVWGEKSCGYSLKVDTKLYNKWGTIKYYSLPCSKNIEIIGNIHENPELLKD